MHQHNTTMDSGGQPTASGTKYSKHDMSGSATDINHVNNLSNSDLGGFSKKPISTIPKTQIQLSHHDSQSSNLRRLNLSKQMTTPRDFYLNLDKKFELIIH